MTMSAEEKCREFIRCHLIEVIREIDYYHRKRLLIAPVITKAALMVDEDQNPFAKVITIAYEESFRFFAYFHDQKALKEALQSLSEVRS